MQFYLNGFYPGDPEIVPVDRQDGSAAESFPEEVDVLIVGSGPAGLVLAAQLAQFRGITTRIVERRAGPLSLGQADGIACRTVEMFEAFGLAEQLLKEAYWVNETVFWRPDGTDRHRIARTGRIQDTEDGLSEFPHVIVNQARIHEYLLGSMRRSTGRLEVDYAKELVDVSVDGDGSHPVRATLRDTHAEGDGSEVTVRAKYVVGCDGARSLVRKTIGRQLHGDAANHAWGVMDILAVTDFPDIRLKAAIQSATDGNILLIPREGGYLVRLYVDLGVVTDQSRPEIRGFGPDDITAVANRVLHPYTLDVKEVAWWSVYEVAQRVTDAFDDADGRTGRGPRIFIAGDACHTHSAKAGQGMNVSMQDAFNLGWKLAAVLDGRSDPALLRTYSEERQPIAQELIDFDREWSAMMGAPPRDPDNPDNGGVDPAELQAYFERAGRYTAGVAARYQPSTLTGQATHQHLATGFEVGTRFHSADVVRVGDARRVQLGHAARADGRWRLYAFADADESKFHALCDWLEGSSASPLQRFTAVDDDPDSVIDVRAVLARAHRDIDFGDLSPVLRPRKGRHGLIDFEKAFAADPAAGDSIYDQRGIDAAGGAMVLVRPDQYVAHVLPLDGYDELASFLDGVFVPVSHRR